MPYDEELADRLRLLLGREALVEMNGRSMKGWLRVEAAAVDDDALLRTWADRGLSYARTLPPKEGRGRVSA